MDHYQRLPAHCLPNEPCACAHRLPCVYRVNGVCDEPRTNKGNSDAACHKSGNREIMLKLKPV